MLSGLTETFDAGVLVTKGDVLAFRHELVRLVMYDAIPEPVRLALHRQIGRMLLERGGSAVPAAGHLLYGSEPGGREALVVLDHAIDEMLSSSPRSAAHLALRAVELTERIDDDRFSRVVTAVNALVAAGRIDDAAKLARSVVGHRGSPPAITARLRLSLSAILFVTGRPQDATTEAEAVLHETGLPDELYAAAESRGCTGS